MSATPLDDDACATVRAKPPGIMDGFEVDIFKNRADAVNKILGEMLGIDNKFRGTMKRSLP